MKTWALKAAGLNQNRLGDGNDYPVPTNDMPVAALQKQLTDALTGIELTGITELEVVHDKPGKLVLRIPSAAQVLAVEEQLGQEEGYPLPPFYRDAFNHAEPTPLPDADARLVFHAQRIGDYTISNCQ